jgi:S1-C subfamily serine protease
MQIPQVDQLQPKPTSEGTSSPVMFKKLVINIPRGEKIGVIQGGLLCVNHGNLTWRGGRAVVAEEDFGQALHDELTAAGYTVVGDPEALFEDTSAWKAEYLIAGIIKDVKANICYPLSAFGNFTSAKGEAFIGVDWQIYSRRSRAVELKISTQGSTKLSQSTDLGGEDLFIQAFQSASRNLLANDQFYGLVAAGQSGDSIKKEHIELIEIAYLSPQEGDSLKSAETLIADARMAVVTVFAGDVHGSGFLISNDGYVLTNQHVVGDARFVKAKFVTGREVSGEVVRTDRPRDVALVKLEYDLYKALPVGHSDSVQPGSEVFAIGTPFEEKLGQTVTKGIISGYREFYGQRVLQSDVNVHPGNSGGPLLNKGSVVVGIAVMGLIIEPGVGTGINYFVPIEHALDALGIKKGKQR